MNAEDHDILIRLEATTESGFKRLEDLLKSLTGTVGDHESRLRSLEQYRWKTVGYAMAGGTFSSMVVSIAIAYLSSR